MMLPSGLTAAALAAAVFGVSAVLQRVGAAADPVGGSMQWRSDDGAGVRWWVRRPARQQSAFAAGVVLDGVGLGLSLVAVRDLPVHVVEAVLASSVAISAVLSALFLDERLDRVRWLAVAVLTIALVVVAGSGVESGEPSMRPLAAAGPPLALAVCAAGAWVLRARVLAWPPAVIGALSGASFGMVALSGRVAHGSSVPTAGWNVLFGVSVAGWSVLGLVLFWAGLRREAVAPVVVGQTLGETLVPTLLALAMGEQWSGGSPALAVVAFSTAIGCAVVIAGWTTDAVRGPEGQHRSPGRDQPVAAARVGDHAGDLMPRCQVPDT